MAVLQVVETTSSVIRPKIDRRQSVIDVSTNDSTARATLPMTGIADLAKRGLAARDEHAGARRHEQPPGVTET